MGNKGVTKMNRKSVFGIAVGVLITLIKITIK